MNETTEPVVYINGKFWNQGEASRILQGKEYSSTGGFYDTERTFNGKIFRLRQHLERLYRGLEYSRLDPGLTIDEMIEITNKTLDANRRFLGPDEEYTITQVASLSPVPASEQSPTTMNVVVYCQKLNFSEFAEGYVNGVRVITPSTYTLSSNMSRSNSGRENVRTYHLMTSSEGSITECRGGNFMFVCEGRIKLPDRDNVLSGVSMQTVLELAEMLEIPVDEGDYSPMDVYHANEAFVSSTRFCILPVTTLNGYSLGRNVPGPTTRNLLDAWREIVGIDFIQQALKHI
mgnify:CR=1 FL=1